MVAFGGEFVNAWRVIKLFSHKNDIFDKAAAVKLFYIHRIVIKFG